MRKAIGAFLVVAFLSLLIHDAAAAKLSTFRRVYRVGDLNDVVMTAAYHGDGESVRLLLSRGADPNGMGCAGGSVRTARTGATPLHEAALKGSAEIIEVLLAFGADANGTDRDGATPLYLAAQFPRPEPVELLLGAGADINASTPDGITALHHAVYCGCAGMVELLIRNGADVNAKTRWGSAELHIASGAHLRKGDEFRSFGAADLRSLKIHKMLLDHGADVNARDEEGHTPMDIAVHWGRATAAAMIQRYGGRQGRELE